MSRGRCVDSMQSSATRRENAVVFERHTPQSLQVIAFAEEEGARRSGQTAIGTTDLLIGLLQVEAGYAARALGRLEVTVERVRALRQDLEASQGSVTSSQPSFTARAAVVDELALREALSLGQNYIGTEHILLALVREEQGVAPRILQELGADARTVPRELIAVLPPSAPLRRFVGRAPTGGLAAEAIRARYGLD